MGVQGVETGVQGDKFYEKSAKMGKMGGSPGTEETEEWNQESRKGGKEWMTGGM